MRWRPYLALLALASGALPAQDLREDLRARYERGLAAAEQGDCKAAVEDLLPVVAAEPRLVPAHNAIGVCQTQLGRPERATASFLQVVKLEPEAWQGWNNLGGNYLALNKPAEAFPALDRAQQLAPGNAQITGAWLDTAGKLATEAADLIEQQQYEKALRLLLLVRRPLENSGSWNNLLGYAEFKLGHPELASKHLEMALKLEPDNEDYLLDIGEFLAYHRAYGKAAEFFEVALRRMPHSPRVRFGLAVAHILQNKRPEAAAALEQLLAEKPRFEAVYRALGECYEDAGNWTGMAELGTRLQALNPNNPLGWYLEGAALERKALESQASPLPAIEALRRAVRLDPGSSRYHFVLAKAYQQADQLDLAVAELQETVRLDPEHERARYVLGRLYQRLGRPELARAQLQVHSRIKARDREAVYRALLLRPERSGATSQEAPNQR